MTLFVTDDGNGMPCYLKGASKARQNPTDHQISEQDWLDYKNSATDSQIKDWEGFREALYRSRNFLDFLESSPLAAKLDDLVWRRQFSLASSLYARLRSNGCIKPELEEEIFAAASSSNILEELSVVTGSES